MKDKSHSLIWFFIVGGALLISIGLRSAFPKLSLILMVAVCIFGIGFLLLIALVIFFAFWRPKPTEEALDKQYGADLLKNGRTVLLSARTAKARIRDERIRMLGTEACDQMERVLKTLKEQPADIPRASLVFSYYLTTLNKVLEKFAYLENCGAADATLVESTASCLTDIRIAMRRQYENLFEDDILDLTVDMQTLTEVCKRNGLLPENE